jgi:adenosylcobinamide hydrolase
VIDEGLPIVGLSMRRTERALHVWSDAPLRTLSSAVVGGGLSSVQHILNIRVRRGYTCREPAADVRALAGELGIGEPFIGMMTAVALDTTQCVVERDAQTTVVAIVTIGVGNAVAAGVTLPATPGPGTINAIIVVDAHMSEAARVNAVLTVTEAKTLALVEVGVRAPHGGPASGTSTDAIVIASTERGAIAEYAGPIAPLGALMARAMRRAVLGALKGMAV